MHYTKISSINKIQKNLFALASASPTFICPPSVVGQGFGWLLGVWAKQRCWCQPPCLRQHNLFIISSLCRQILYMHEDTGFNFTEAPLKQPPEQQFKRQRAAYIAQRNARKLEAQMMARRQKASDSSSEEKQQPPPLLKQMPVLKKEKEGSNTDSSNSPKESNFRQQRLKYKEERLARKQEALLNKKEEFGSSSSEDNHPSIRPRAGRPPPPQLKIQRPFREDSSSSSYGFGSADLGRRSHEGREGKEGKGMLSSVRLKDKRSQRRELRERYEVQVPSKKGVNIWLERWLEFKDTSFELAERTIALYDVTKIKLLFTPTPSGCLTIKLTLTENEEIFIAVNSKRINELHYLDQYYFIFAKIITLKLQIMGRRPQPLSRVREGLSQQILRDARLAGKVRKSSFFGGWEEKIGVVGSAGLALYKAGKEKAGLMVGTGQVKELWTRFEFQRENLVLKLVHGSSKVELSVPCQDFLCRENWLYQLYTLASK